MKKIIVFFVCFFSLNIGIAQIDTTGNECSTIDIDTTEFQQLPWFDNNQFLENFLDSIGYPAAGLGYRIVEAPQVRFWIPVKFWIYRDDNGNGGPTQVQIQRMIDKLNRIYNQQNNTLIGFYMKCEPTYINNSQHLIKNFVGASLLMAANRELGCFNVHVVDELQFAVGMALKPIGACIVNRATYIRDDNYTLSHEVGHLLGLIHTHIFWDWQIKCFKESVSRTRTWPTFNFCFGNKIRSNRVCESTGDGLSDTEADPRLLSNFSCNYDGGGSDLWGDSYTNPPNGSQESPNTHNVMSYQGMDACVDQFSRLQIGVMLYNLYISNAVNGVVWRNPIHTFDDFEPDNNSEMTTPISIKSRNISINEIQERNFHQQYNTIPNVPVPQVTQCDVDWVRFVAPCNSNLEVFTSAMPNRINANTRLTLFDNNLVQLAQNDDITPTNHFSSIQFNFIAGVEYFIRVENMSNLTTGYYNLQVGRFSIQGNSPLCTPSTFTVQNLPSGATVTWSATPSGIVAFNPGGPTTNPSTTVSRIIDGNVTITATINNCGNQFVLNMPLVVGAVVTGYYIINSNYHQSFQRTLYTNNSPIWLPANQSFGITAYITNSNPSSPNWTRATSSYPFSWSSSGVQLNFSGLAGSTTYNQRNAIFNFTANTGCGVTTSSFTWPIIVQGWGFKVAASPNPATGNLNISIIDESKEVQALSKDETVTMTLYDLNKTNAVKIWTFKNLQTKFNLNINNIKKGHYILKVQIGKYQQSEQIIIE